MGSSRNPYVIKGGPRLRPSVVAFVDILGYTDLVKKIFAGGGADALLKELHRALRESRKQVDPKHDDVSRRFSKKDFSAFRAFTDNVVIGHPIYDDGESELGSMFSDLAFFQMILAMNGFFVRGAISVGEFYMDDIAVFGPALIEAYEAEQRLARDPRIVLTASAKEAVEGHLKYYGRKKHAPQVRDLLKDSDGQYFLNYLDTIVPEEGYFYEQELKRHKAAIERKLVEHQANPPIWSKYIWVAEYHNYYCENCPEDCTHLKIDLEKYKMRPRSIVD